METALDSSFIAWKKTLPSSRMVRPTRTIDLLKYAVWRLYTPIHPFARDLLLRTGVLEHQGRQNYILGKLASGVSIKDAVSYLIEHGYGNHFIAWIDDGEVVGIRRVYGFTHQYHIRFFADGEVRGHYEYTPEYRPLWHYKAVGMEDKRQDVLNLLGNKIIPA